MQGTLEGCGWRKWRQNDRIEKDCDDIEILILCQVDGKKLNSSFHENTINCTEVSPGYKYSH